MIMMIIKMIIILMWIDYQAEEVARTNSIQHS